MEDRMDTKDTMADNTAVARFLEQRQMAGFHPRTVRVYRACVQDWFAWRRAQHQGAALPVVTGDEVRQFLARPATTRTQRVVMQAFWRFLVQECVVAEPHQVDAQDGGGSAVDPEGQC
jgi:hypothetical protein